MLNCFHILEFCCLFTFVGAKVLLFFEIRKYKVQNCANFCSFLVIPLFQRSFYSLFRVLNKVPQGLKLRNRTFPNRRRKRQVK